MKIYPLRRSHKTSSEWEIHFLLVLAYPALPGYYQNMELEYTYFEAEDGFFVGWFDNFPEDITQGKSLEELEEMLADMYECLNLSKYHKRKLVLA